MPRNCSKNEMLSVWQANSLHNRLVLSYSSIDMYLLLKSTESLIVLHSNGMFIKMSTKCLNHKYKSWSHSRKEDNINIQLPLR